jgi:hypothetical protein
MTPGMGFPGQPWVGQLHVYWYVVTEAERRARPAPPLWTHPFAAVFEWDGVTWSRLPDQPESELAVDAVDAVDAVVTPAAA